MRLLKSVANVGIALGPFGYVKKSVIIAAMWHIVIYTINLLLTF